MENRAGNFRNALVVGTVRNASANMDSDILRIINALEEILPTKAFIVESDSSDSTVTKLTELSAKESRIRFISLGAVAEKFPDRIERLRYCRNRYVNEIRENPLYHDCDLIIVADLDGINTRINVTAFQIALHSELAWDALAANQSARYYDILALRHPLWSPNNWEIEADWLAPFLGKKAAKKHAMTDRMIRIPPTTAPILVNSAFGGLCIYRRWVFDQCDYSEDPVDSSGENEHVTIHRKVNSYGGKIFIHPELINSSWTTHSLGGTTFVSTLNSVAQVFPFRLLLPILRRILLFFAKHI